MTFIQYLYILLYKQLNGVKLKDKGADLRSHIYQYEVYSFSMVLY